MQNVAPIRKARLLERFLRYVRVDTTANPDTQQYPSSPGQLVLGQLLTAELQQMGLDTAHQDEHGLVWATIPATVPGSIPTVLLNAHLDTSPDASGKNVQPQVIESYAGGDITLPNSSLKIEVEACPALLGLLGHTLITSDGTTLLGGDDKAGVATLMELAHHLIENPHIPHGEIRILFTCDEEIGCGAQHLDLSKANAAAGYTLDGSGAGEVENENFSADQLLVRAIGNNIHPSIGKGRMCSALRGLSKLIASLPNDSLSPESTEGKEGFVHPYQIDGSVDSAVAKFLLRDFETGKLDEYEALIRQTAAKVAEQQPGLQFEFTRQRQYRNMNDVLARSPHVVEFATRAFERIGLSAKLGSIRGGTDGAIFSEMGLPTPNLSVGQHNIHSVTEFASLDEMAAALEHLIALLDLWQAEARS